MKLRHVAGLMGAAVAGGATAHYLLRQPAAPAMSAPPLVLPGGSVASEKPGNVDPLVVALHGAGGDERQLVPYLKDSTQNVVFLRAPLRQKEGFQWLTSRIKVTPTAKLLTELERVAGGLRPALAAAKAQRGASRLVVVGYSQGGHLAWWLAAQGVVDGAVVVNGALPADFKVPRPHRRTFIYWLSGVEDRTVPWELVRETVGGFRSAGYDIDGHQVKAGHSLSSVGPGIGAHIGGALANVLGRMRPA